MNSNSKKHRSVLHSQTNILFVNKSNQIKYIKMHEAHLSPLIVINISYPFYEQNNNMNFLNAFFTIKINNYIILLQKFKKKL